MVNIMSSWYLESANHCSGAFDHTVNEMAIAGLTNIASDVVKPPRVAEAAVQFECEVSNQSLSFYIKLYVWFYNCIHTLLTTVGGCATKI